jgi:tripartite-type tricarboxylate transporter receptor subunit TctC
VLLRVIALLLALAIAPLTFAQQYPARPVRLIVPQTAGAFMDVLVRIVAAKLTELTGQTFVADNRGGAGGVIGTEIGARAATDTTQSQSS